MGQHSHPVATDSLHDEFEHVTSGLLGQGGEKSINEIQSILASAEAKFLSKRAVGTTAELAHRSRNSNQKRKSTATSEDECFNCHKMGHFGRDCRHPDYRLVKKKSTGNVKDRKDLPRPRHQNPQQRRHYQPRRRLRPRAILTREGIHDDGVNNHVKNQVHVVLGLLRVSTPNKVQISQ